MLFDYLTVRKRRRLRYRADGCEDNGDSNRSMEAHIMRSEYWKPFALANYLSFVGYSL
jgi:hypothetical protein